jgi:hypothetical protein
MTQTLYAHMNKRNLKNFLKHKNNTDQSTKLIKELEGIQYRSYTKPFKRLDQVLVSWKNTKKKKK